MGYEITTDHDTIRAWVDERGGFPVAVREASEEIVDLAFSPPLDDYERIPWSEFFDLFDSLNLVFQFDPEAGPDEAADAWSFASRELADVDGDDETDFVEDNELAEENSFQQLREQDTQ